jgi:LPPG:FO 2-phospho-L-lactate transferase
MSRRIVALAGGVGGAKLVLGLAHHLPADALTVIGNTGDDFVHLGLHVSPDLDTVMYTLAGIANPETGWGVAGDTFQMLDMLDHYGADPWFRLGDRDLATHLLRTEMLRAGHTLTEVTDRLCRALGVGQRLLPMSDDRVATLLETDVGRLEFQDYFVRRRWQPIVREIIFEGIDAAAPTTAVLEAVERADAIVLCPSNPYVSLDPILSLPGLREAIRTSSAVKLGVSSIIGGEAVKGPAAKMMRELGETVAPRTIAVRYADILDIFLVDWRDEGESATIRAHGVQPLVTDILMPGLTEKVRLAGQILDTCRARLEAR